MSAAHAVNAVLAALVVGTAGMNWYVRQPIADRALEFAPDMVRSPAFEAYEANANFPDGMTLRAPVAGTIARGHAPLAYGPSAIDAMRAGNELANPFSAGDAAAVERGQVVYVRYCEVCHAADGSGGGPVIDSGFRKPPSLLRPFTRQMKDGQLFHLATYGRGLMPAHGAQITVPDRWKAVLYLRRLQQGAPAAGARAE
jgi:cytochrome c5